jgi:hypothetical protein
LNCFVEIVTQTVFIGKEPLRPISLDNSETV